MTESNYRIAPSILSADFTELGGECQNVLNAGADWLHVDVMDGHFVPNLTIGLPVVSALRKRFPDVTLDVHLMISNPDEFVVPYIEAGADYVSFHPEATYHPHRVVQTIHKAGAKASLAINPHTPPSLVEYLLGDIDMLLVMSVNPGFGGQTFISSALDKIRALRAMCHAQGLQVGQDLEIEVDGGIRASNIAEVARAGATVFVAGSAIFRSDSYADTIAEMRRKLISLSEGDL